MSLDLAIRLAALVQLIILLGCGFAWHMSHRDHIPRRAWLIGWGYGYVIVLTAAAITINAAETEPVTVGMRATTVFLVPATLWVVALTARQGRTAAVRARDVLAWVDGLDDLEPCESPDCVHARAEARRIAGRSRP